MRTFLFWLLSLLGPVAELVEALGRRLGRVIGLLLLPFFMLAAAIGRFVGRWWNSRNRLWLIQGLPAFLTAIAVAATSLAAWLPTRRDLANKYLDLALEMTEDGDDASAALYMEKAARAWNKSDSTEFRRVLVLEKTGREVEGQQLLLELAPVDQVGHIPAHELLIDRLNRQTDNPKAQELVKIHSSLILSQNPDHARVHRLLAVKAIQAKDLESALEHLAFAVRRFPRLGLPYAQLLRVAGNKDESTRQTEALAVFFEQEVFSDDTINLLKGESTVTTQDRVAYTACLTMLKRYDQAITIVRAGENVPEDPMLRAAMANTYLAWSDTFDSDSVVSLTEKMIRLGAALKLAPNSRDVLFRVAQISTLTGRPAEDANQRLRKILAAGKAPAIVHFILGTSAAEANDKQKALFHLEQACRINPNVPVTLNNLAWVMAHETDVETDRSKLERAKRLIDKALKFKPTHPQFRETNAQILIRLEEWKDAITEFEFALQYLKGARPRIHKALALAYGKVGDAAMSRLHQDLVDVITDEPDSTEGLLPVDTDPQAGSKPSPTVVQNSNDDTHGDRPTVPPETEPRPDSKPNIDPGVGTSTKTTTPSVPVGPVPIRPVPSATQPKVEELPAPPEDSKQKEIVEELPAPPGEGN
jgi:tetratricopeptide (TPR) repeat protein